MKNRYFTKYCGITNLKDALAAQQAGCNAIGFVFVKSSKRYINIETCQQIIKDLSPALMRVALFANNSKSEIQETIKQCSFHVLQFHGSESAEFCRQWNVPYWKAVPMADCVNIVEYAKKYPDAEGFLLDNFGQQQSGGSGQKFAWDEIPKNLNDKWILAGGLTVENIQQARDFSSLKCFDVSSGIEIKPGLKSQTKMINFIKKLND
jgi:phosphoribosylanthranilate isomerase